MPYGLVLNGSLVAAPDDAKYLLSPQVDMTTQPNHLSLTPFPALRPHCFLSPSVLSEQDLSAIDLVPELIVAGVKSFKIEGRLKVPETLLPPRALLLQLSLLSLLHRDLPTARTP